jgi:transcriptional regulator with XRE-family HTH domain
LSLRELAARAGVSKALLSNIERGTGNPSIETLWRIVGAVEIPFSELTRTQDVRPEIVRRSGANAMTTDDGKMSIRLLFATSERARVELFELEMPPGVRSEWHSHGRGTREYTIVTSGDVVVEVGSETHRLGEGDMIGFDADQDHTYESLQGSVAMLCAVAYARD